MRAMRGPDPQAPRSRIGKGVGFTHCPMGHTMRLLRTTPPADASRVASRSFAVARVVLVLSAFVAPAIAVSPAVAQLAPPNAAGLTYGHVHLNVTSIEHHQAFWAEHFGGEPVERGSLRGILFPSLLLLLSEREPTGGSQGSVMDHFGFKVRDIEAVLIRWRAAGYEVQSEFIGAEGNPNAYMVGPDGVRIELQEDPDQFEDVTGHHIHFFTPGHAELLAWYVDVFGLEPFERGTIATTANAPGMNLSFNAAGSERDPTRGRAIDHIGFELTDLDAFVRRLEARGIELEGPVRDIPQLGLKVAFLTDPRGVHVELTEGLLGFGEP